MSISRNHEPVHNYLDINIVNNSVSQNSTAPQPIVFSTSRNSDYLMSPDAYYVSVIRWTMDSRLPIIIPQIQLNQEFDPVIGGYKTVYSFCLTIDGKKPDGTVVSYTSGQVFINLVSQQDYLPHPVGQIKSLNETYNNPYFYVDSVQYFLEGVNKALTSAWDIVYALYLADWAGITPLPLLPQKPFIQYNYDGTFTLYASASFLDTINLTQNGAVKASIFMNSSLYTLFNGFSAINQGYSNIINGMNNYIQVINNGQIATVNYNGVSLTYNYMITEYGCVQFWCPASSVVFTSLGIPVCPTNTAPTNVFGDSPNLGSDTSNLDFQNIITDFNIDFQTGTEGRQVVSYAPSGEYRLFDLVGNRPLSQLNIQCYWKDKVIGALHQMYLFSGGSATLKLMFRKKTFYLGQ